MSDQPTATGDRPDICPVCLADGARRGSENEYFDADIRCINCGDHKISSRAMAVLRKYAGLQDWHTLARIAYAVRKLPNGALLSAEMLVDVMERVELPPASEQLDNLVLHLAGAARPGVRIRMTSATLRSIVGAETHDEVQWVVSEAIRHEFIQTGDSRVEKNGAWVWMTTALTMDGWNRRDALLRDGAGSRHAFMAMKFGDPALNAFYRDHMRPAVAAAGFDLRTTNEDHKTAGSIDNRMRVEIRTSRFVVCALTHGNRGAYWEAGFAEGLGRPVFYVCRADVLSDKNHADHPHFDTAHQLIIPWDPAAPADSMAELKAVIRATLPAEAHMEDAD